MQRRQFFFLVLLMACVFFIMGCSISAVTPAPVSLRETASKTLFVTGYKPETQTPQTGKKGAPTETATYPCPVATQELPPWVEPLTSPTDQLTQVVVVHMNFLEEATVTTESGAFTAAGDGSVAKVEIKLLPNTIHHLSISAKIKSGINSDGCTYGGYSMTTQVDRDGNSLVIIQGQPVTPQAPSGAISPDNAAGIQSLFTLSLTNLANDFIFNGNNEMITFGNGSTIDRWDVNTLKISGHVGGESAESQPYYICAAINPDQSLLATGEGFTDFGVKAWDLKTGKVAFLGKYNGKVVSVLFNPSGKLLASGAADNTINIWDVSSGKLVNTLTGDMPNFIETFESIFWSDEQTIIAMGVAHAYKWDVSSGKLIDKTADNPTKFVIQAAFSQSGDLIAGAAQDAVVYMWERKTNIWSTIPARDGVEISRVAFSPDGKLLVAVTYTNDLFVWDMQTQKQLFTRTLTRDIRSIHFSPDGRYLGLLVEDGKEIELWGAP